MSKSRRGKDPQLGNIDSKNAHATYSYLTADEPIAGESVLQIIPQIGCFET
jgi:hypothetical protein